MPATENLADFNPETDIPSLVGKVILITGGTAGIGLTALTHFLAHSPSHIYFTGRNAHAASSLIASLTTKHPSLDIPNRLTFIPMDLTSLRSIPGAINSHFKHSRLDILICNAGIMCAPPSLSPSGYEIQFTTNHLGHAMLIRLLLPILLQTVKIPSADVRILSLSSIAYKLAPRKGILYAELDSKSTMHRWWPGAPWYRYAQSKLANILYASALARLYPSITSISIHPGVVKTGLVENQGVWNRWFIWVTGWVMGKGTLTPDQGCWNTVWAAVVARKKDLRNGGFYLPVGVDAWDVGLEDMVGREMDERLWEWTERVLDEVEA